jgi:hypothetical protein
MVLLWEQNQFPGFGGCPIFIRITPTRGLLREKMFQDVKRFRIWFLAPFSAVLTNQTSLNLALSLIGHLNVFLLTITDKRQKI